MTRDDLLTFDGITQSINEWGLDYGITPQTIMRRLHGGMSVEVAICKPITARPGDQLPEPVVARPRAIKLAKPRVVDRYIYGGKSHTVTEWAELTGISPETMRSRIKAGHPMKDVLRKGTLPKGRRSHFKGIGQRRPAKLYTVNGMTRSLSYWADQAGIQQPTLRRRIKRGVTMEQALAVTLGERTRAVHTIDGTSKTLHEWADHAGIKYNALIARIHKGRSLAEAVAMGRGVVSDLPAPIGTGGGSTVQESTDIGFSK